MFLLSTSVPHFFLVPPSIYTSLSSFPPVTDSRQPSCVCGFRGGGAKGEKRGEDYKTTYQVRHPAMPLKLGPREPARLGPRRRVADARRAPQDRAVQRQDARALEELGEPSLVSAFFPCRYLLGQAMAKKTYVLKTKRLRAQTSARVRGVAAATGHGRRRGCGAREEAHRGKEKRRRGGWAFKAFDTSARERRRGPRRRRTSTKVDGDGIGGMDMKRTDAGPGRKT